MAPDQSSSSGASDVSMACGATSTRCQDFRLRRCPRRVLLLRYSPLIGVAEDRRSALYWRLKRVLGLNVIAPRRRSSAHFRRPWRATVRFFTKLSPIGSRVPHQGADMARETCCRSPAAVNAHPLNDSLGASGRALCANLDAVLLWANAAHMRALAWMT